MNYRFITGPGNHAPIHGSPTPGSRHVYHNMEDREGLEGGLSTQWLEESTQIQPKGGGALGWDARLWGWAIAQCRRVEASAHLLPTPHPGKAQIVEADHEANLPFGKSQPCTLTFVWVRQWYPKGAERQWASECRQAEFKWAKVCPKRLGDASKKWTQR